MLAELSNWSTEKFMSIFIQVMSFMTLKKKMKNILTDSRMIMVMGETTEKDDGDKNVVEELKNKESLMTNCKAEVSASA